ncbi:ATP-dependent DNA helicase, RecQ family [Hoylesella oralis ATCC 33269]|uniref:ATP-dependent DNA helicase RecQ n=1 Tax=Hoylesella oralis ATCC 33269 TaxID=873533 RepID=E7RP84_9BACT|nr:ATP-dependent DNA helicase RecQ [Hoylesella oralis]EFZ37527.1 ATP-dependent DNA helicase, RecQ family [Hoylesella oralis ATCC 33269]EPH16028.1 RecQ family ATP-dependent DNA helicase [Hoylesella oralis HGA0225]SHF90052.1 ATP-dependent DNA helicase RecQ [Hoylesella oralis]
MAQDCYLSILQQYWGYRDFRGIQREIIESIGSGHDTLGLMPTGGGKSITFQVPALAKEGVCIVITPLIALMKDQVQHLRDKGISATAIHAGMSRKEIVVALENCIFGGIKLLYVSPERIGSDLFQNKLRRMKVSFITVDEAHCISQWGYDFRPSYLHVADIRRLLPHVPILALTATATPQVVEDIQDKLNFEHRNVFRMSFERKNLAYVVRNTTDKYGELIHILSSVQGSAIVYVRSRKRSKEISEMLNKHQIPSTFYHAGLEYSQKDERQKDWQQDRIRVIVATNAFGMGIDKPEVRLVVHFDCPDSLEAYFQEAGRAGRDGNRSYAVLLYNNSDQRKLHKRITDTFPEKEFIKQIYEHLAYFYQVGLGSGSGHIFSFDIDKFCRTYKHFPIQTDSALKILERAGYLDYETDPDASARLMFMLNRDELYKLESTTAHEELVITALLRNYGGLFTDYVYIDEGLIAQQTGLNQQQVYLLLKGLSQRRILHFIPQRKTPYITYTQRREEMNRIIIPKEVYEMRKEQYVLRIQSMIHYAENDDVCRSRQLIRYFGEEKSRDCMLCDVCLEHYTNQLSEDRIEPAKAIITAFLHDGKKHHITELHQLNIPERQLHGALAELISEEEITMEGSFLLMEN